MQREQRRRIHARREQMSLPSELAKSSKSAAEAASLIVSSSSLDDMLKQLEVVEVQSRKCSGRGLKSSSSHSHQGLALSLQGIVYVLRMLEYIPPFV